MEKGIKQATINKTNQKETTYDHVLKYTGLFGGVQGFNIILSIVRTKLVAMLIGSGGMGLCDLYSRSIDLISNSTNFGISFSAVKHLSLLYEQGNDEAVSAYIKLIRSWSLLTAMFGIIVCCLLSPLISYFTFDDYTFTTSFCMLSPMVGMMAINGGEMAILKSTRRLKRIALISIFTALATLLITIPIYFIIGPRGIIPVLVITTFAAMVILLNYTTRIYPWKASPFSRFHLRRGTKMIKLGISFILAGVAGSGAEMIIRTFIFKGGNLGDVGLYAAGFTLSITYSRLVFVAMDSDYYPRLSASMNNFTKMNDVVNRQLELCLLLMSPFLVFFMLALPFIIHMLYTAEFLEAVPMTICASFYMFFKAITSPVAYLSLAKGDSLTYFIMELIYDLAFIAIIIISYNMWGLVGAGIGLSLSNLFDMILIISVYHQRYKFKLSSRAVWLIFVQGILVMIGLFAALSQTSLMKYGLGLPVLAISSFITFRILQRETTIISKLRQSITNKLKKKKQ